MLNAYCQPLYNVKKEPHERKTTLSRHILALCDIFP